MSIVSYEKLIDIIVDRMKEQAKCACVDKVEIDISGGVDSALVAALSVIAFGKENVIGVFTNINSSREFLIKSRLLSKKFNFKLVELNLTDVYKEIVDRVEKEFNRLGVEFQENDYVYGSFRSCLRAPIGRFVNRAFGGGLRQGTGNLDEDEFLRFFQKGGDGEVDNNWISCLYKSEVWELAEYLGVPSEIINSKPSPDLWGIGVKHNDEDELKKLSNGMDITYTRPNGKLGTIEWASRENFKNNCIFSVDNLENFGYNKEEIGILEFFRDMERKTRHKVQLPLSINRKDLMDLNIVK